MMFPVREGQGAVFIDQEVGYFKENLNIRYLDL